MLCFCDIIPLLQRNAVFILERREHSMSNCTIAKAVFDWNNSQEQLLQLTELMKEAFVVFDYETAWCCKLDQVTPVVEKYWAKFPQYHVDFGEPDYDKVWEKSLRVSKAFITRKDFNKFLTPYKETIEKCADELSKEVEKKRQHIVSLYENSEYFSESSTSFIFKQGNIQNAIIQFLLS